MSQARTLGDETIIGLLSQAMAVFSGGDGLAGRDDAPSVATIDRPDSDLDERICAAAMQCVARRGLRKTTLDDVAPEAVCSRATIYRAFPGGKDVLMAAPARREAELVLADLAGELAMVTTLED